MLQACTQKTSAGLTAKDEQNETLPPKEPGYLIDENNDGVYEFVHTEEKVVFFVDEMGVYQEMYKHLLYPADAREKGIQGQVILEASVNEFGYVTNIVLIKSVYPSIDAAAKDAFTKATANGYGQLRWNLNFVKFKVTVPIKFVLQGKR